jgi:hypothetical protein
MGRTAPAPGQVGLFDRSCADHPPGCVCVLCERAREEATLGPKWETKHITHGGFSSAPFRGGREWEWRICACGQRRLKSLRSRAALDDTRHDL